MPKLTALTAAVAFALSLGSAIAEDEPPAADTAAASDSSQPTAAESTQPAPMESADVAPAPSDAASDSDSNK